MNYILLLAGGVSAFGLVMHLMTGRTRALHPPLTTAEIEASLKADAWFGRHLQTILLAAMALVFGNASRQEGAHDVAFWLALVGFLGACLKLALGVQAGAHRLDVREWGAMGLAAMLGLIGTMI